MQTTKKQNSNIMWGGRFEASPAEIMEKINESISFDQRLTSQDIKGSVAHCKMLAKQNIITKKESELIIDGLGQVKEEIKAGNFEFSTKLEDIHMNVEHRLSEIIGDVAGKLHTARSRNDQVATDFKLWTRENLEHLSEEVTSLQNELVEQAEKHYNTIMPGFTHLQSAQPVTFGHHLLAYYEMLRRDKKRIANCIDNLNECPLGSAALAGTSYDIDREFIAKELGFNCPNNNSLDGVSDRDFVIESLSVISTIAMHLSRLAEEFVIWSSYQFQFVRLSDQYTTGSSIMPQKKNPDAAELIRAKTGRIFGSLQTILVVMKGLPLAYSKDMQEDKECAFDAFDNVILCVKAMTGMVKTMQVNKDKMKQSLESGFPTATDLADWLVQKLNIPFRQAHHITGSIVKLAENKNCKLEELSLEDMQDVESKIDSSVYEVLKLETCINRRISFGGTAPKNVLEQVKNIKK